MNLLQRILQSKTLERSRRQFGKLTGLHLRLKRFTASASEPLRTARLLHHMGIELVLDVGANTGQFAESLYDFGYIGRVYSFEPVGTAHRALVHRSRAYPNWTVMPPCAIGDRDGEVDVRVSDDSVFSSVLQIEESFVARNPKARTVKTERRPLRRLDSLAQELSLDPGIPTLLKIDTQGFEREVLTGAEQLLTWVHGLKVEIPLYPIYKDNDFTFYEIVEFMKAGKFEPYSFHVEGVDLDTGRVNTLDGLFFRHDP